MKRETIEQRLAQLKAQLTELIAQAEKQIAFLQGSIAALESLLQDAPEGDAQAVVAEDATED